jgi:hypothetical protein
VGPAFWHYNVICIWAMSVPYLFTYFDGVLPRLFTEMKVCWKTFLKGGTRR